MSAVTSGFTDDSTPGAEGRTIKVGADREERQADALERIATALEALVVTVTVSEIAKAGGGMDEAEAACLNVVRQGAMAFKEARDA